MSQTMADFASAIGDTEFCAQVCGVLACMPGEWRSERVGLTDGGEEEFSIRFRVTVSQLIPRRILRPTP